MTIKKNHLVIIILSFYTFFVYAQKTSEIKSDTINTEVTYIVKPYSPKISDAFKVKEMPSLDDKETNGRRDLKYNIFSIPVASTFIPVKKIAAPLDKIASLKLYDNYASFGVGSYKSLVGEIYINHIINNSETFGGYLHHHSSQGGIDNVYLDNDFSGTSAMAHYSKKTSNYSWNIYTGAEHQKSNWYGVPVEIFDDSTLELIDPEHRYFSFELGGELTFTDQTINDVIIYFRRFVDDYDSNENRFKLTSNIDIPVLNGELNTMVKFDYIDGLFQKQFFGDNNIKYGNYQLGIIPSYQIKENDLILNLGISAYYMRDSNLDKNKFYLYPKITLTYNIVKDVLIAYGGIQGDLIQNSYRDFTLQNSFMSPSLLIMPTDQQYHVYGGIKGKISNTISYNFKGQYKSEDNSALIRSNITQIGETENYQYGNSFGVVYDDLDIFSVFGEINIHINKNFNLGARGEYFNFITQNESKAWNRPDFEGSVFMDFQLDRDWYTGANLFFVGQRIDQSYIINPLINSSGNEVLLESYLDMNAYVGHKINDQWSLYAKANNIANLNYKPWINYQVQGLQFVIGATYQFDF